MTVEPYGEATFIRKLLNWMSGKRRRGFAAVGVTRNFRKENAWMYR